ncbi:MAG: hypothetical protein GF317_13240 [Candidatus Lokiarchaeota archaeon]|nr:hypothetical protein [Candidatus Lokiarchaeota archaeon]MBD3200601.1 hypothetical protein [Candidatus Lokiarchaeota archaeon]
MLIISTQNPTGYCQKCGQRVLLTRRSLDWGLAIILLIFTAGVGLIIYIIHYYTQPENICIHCGALIENKETNQLNDKSNINEEIISHKSTNNNPYRFQVKDDHKKKEDILQHIKGVSFSYCSFCGERTDPNSDLCQNCGSKI